MVILVSSLTFGLWSGQIEGKEADFSIHIGMYLFYPVMRTGNKEINKRKNTD